MQGPAYQSYPGRNLRKQPSLCPWPSQLFIHFLTKGWSSPFIFVDRVILLAKPASRLIRAGSAAKCFPNSRLWARSQATSNRINVSLYKQFLSLTGSTWSKWDNKSIGERSFRQIRAGASAILASCFSGKWVIFFLMYTHTKVDSAGRVTLFPGTVFVYINGCL